MHIVATEAGDAVRVHLAGYEIVALHAILVRCAIRKMREGGLAEFVFLELPHILERGAGLESDGPIVVFAIDRVLERSALGMALDADIVGANIIQARGIHDIRRGGALDMSASRAVALFAADVPLGDGFGFGVVVDGMAAVAERAG